MINETYQKKVKSIIEQGETSEEVVNKIVNLTNRLKEDIAEAIKEKAQSSGGVDFIDVPKAIEIVANGGIPTKRELIELAREYMNDGDKEKANEMFDLILYEQMD